MSTFAQVVAMLKPGLTVDITNCDVGPRVETLLNQSTYLGIWCYSDVDQTLFSLEVREVEEDSDTWFEDGPVLKSGAEVRFFATFDEAFAIMSAIITVFADKSPV